MNHYKNIVDFINESLVLNERRRRGVGKDLPAEQRAAHRSEKKFGKDFPPENGKPGATEIRRKTHEKMGRLHRGKGTPEDIAWGAKKREEKEAETTPKSKKLTGPQKGGMKRSIKSRLAKGPSKPMPVPDWMVRIGELISESILINERTGAARIYRMRQSTKPHVRQAGEKRTFEPYLRTAERSGEVSGEQIRSAGTTGAALRSGQGDPSLHKVVGASTKRIIAGRKKSKVPDPQRKW